MISGEGVPGEPSLDLAGNSDAEAADNIDVYQQGFSWLRDPRFISVAAVQGHSIGAGFQLALHCDIRIAAEDVQFCMFEPALGLVPDLGGTQLLVDAIGYAKAIEICATARRIGAEEAARSGLVNLVVPNEQLSDAVNDLAAALMSTNPEAVTETKRLLLGARNREYDEQRRAEREIQVQRLRALMALTSQ
jgi:enoyl-CoA hydratase/carnithine racemase